MQVNYGIQNKYESDEMNTGPDIACKMALRKINGLETALGDVKNVSFLLSMIPLF